MEYQSESILLPWMEIGLFIFGRKKEERGKNYIFDRHLKSPIITVFSRPTMIISRQPFNDISISGGFLMRLTRWQNLPKHNDTTYAVYKAINNIMYVIIRIGEDGDNTGGGGSMTEFGRRC